ncbi:hypothetical protein [Streptomyces sp. AS02]|uniref:hypothetical protein n=1 Tax=Streptomyces sp. AS02 TaxID=2938946 RepID=UPI002020D920|nr:hypothetical protein [Streptomyces sp. AS02]MCL8014550.1 hypothetical protein [Streptomyces sp. AS02]
MSEHGFDHREAPENVIAERNALADRVCRELTLAGMPAFRDDRDDQAGAQVEVDTGDDAAGGVFVDWRTDPTLRQAAFDSMQSGDYTAPAIRHDGAVCSHMQKAIIGILTSAGFQAEAAATFDGDLRPLSVRVASR